MTDTVPVEHTDDALDVGGLWTYRWGARKRPHLHPVRTPGRRGAHPRRPRRPPVAPRPLVHDQVRRRGQLLGGDGALRRAPPRRPARGGGAPRRLGAGEGDAALDPARPETVAVDEQRELAHVPIDDRRLRHRPRHHARTHHRRALRPHAVHDLGRLRRPRPAGVRRLDRHPPAPRRRRRARAGARRALAVVSTSRARSTARPPACTCSTTRSNRRHPVPFYGSTRAATYGEGWSNFLNAAFLLHEPLDVAAGEALRIRHRVVVHDGAWDAGAGRSGLVRRGPGDRGGSGPRRPPGPAWIAALPRRHRCQPPPGLRHVAPDGLAGGTPHCHTACTEAYVVVAGSGRVATLSGAGYAETPIRAGSFVWFTPGTIHRLLNDGGDLEIVVLMQNAGLPEAGDMVITFDDAVLADPDGVRRGGVAPRADHGERARPRPDATRPRGRGVRRPPRGRGTGALGRVPRSSRRPGPTSRRGRGGRPGRPARSPRRRPRGRSSTRWRAATAPTSEARRSTRSHRHRTSAAGAAAAPSAPTSPPL